MTAASIPADGHAATGVSVHDLSVAFETHGGRVPVLERIHLEVRPGRTVGIVGESGSGKTTLARALMRYLPPNGQLLSGTIDVNGRNLLDWSATELRDWRRTQLAVVHQEAGDTLDPSMRIGAQLEEVLRLQGVASGDRAEGVLQLLREVRLPQPEILARRYPHELSGGQQQRVVIAAALATRPSLLILDEPTTGLDASIEAEVLGLLAELRDRLDAAVVLISHDLELVGHLCDDVAVLYAGRIVEQGPAAVVLAEPRHPYTAALLNSAPTLGVPRWVRRLAAIPGAPPDPARPPAGCRFAARCAFADDQCREHEPEDRQLGGRVLRCHHTEQLDLRPTQQTPGPAPVEPVREPVHEPVRDQSAGDRLQVRGLSRSYDGLPVVDGVDLDIAPSEVFGLVGESGSGKTTLARAIMGIGPSGGSGLVALSGTPLPLSLRRRDSALRRRLQMVFQQPDATLNPSHRVRTVLARSLKTLQGKEDPETLADRVQLDPALLDALTPALSGGQKQRVAIARAFAGDPELVVCDEPVSALDVSVQAGVLELLASEREKASTSYLFISHDLAVVGYLADRIGVMYRGEMLEIGPASQVLAGPHHPYTAALVAASQRRGPATVQTPERFSEVGCRFADRCPLYLGPVCSDQHPVLSRLENSAAEHSVRCHLPADELPTAVL
jgi:peptide/nickel transport system ATP-binding protein